MQLYYPFYLDLNLDSYLRTAMGVTPDDRITYMVLFINCYTMYKHNLYT